MIWVDSRVLHRRNHMAIRGCDMQHVFMTRKQLNGFKSADHVIIDRVKNVMCHKPESVIFLTFVEK